MHEEIYRKDLENRFPTYVFTSGTDGSFCTYTATENGTVKAFSRMMELSKAIFNVREQLVGGLEVDPMLTTAQIAALTGVCEGTRLFNTTMGCCCICTDSVSNTWA